MKKMLVVAASFAFLPIVILTLMPAPPLPRKDVINADLTRFNTDSCVNKPEVTWSLSLATYKSDKTEQTEQTILPAHQS